MPDHVNQTETQRDDQNQSQSTRSDVGTRSDLVGGMVISAGIGSPASSVYQHRSFKNPHEIHTDEGKGFRSPSRSFPTYQVGSSPMRDPFLTSISTLSSPLQLGSHSRSQIPRQTGLASPSFPGTSPTTYLNMSDEMLPIYPDMNAPISSSSPILSKPQPYQARQYYSTSDQSNGTTPNPVRCVLFGQTSYDGSTNEPRSKGPEPEPLISYSSSSLDNAIGMDIHTLATYAENLNPLTSIASRFQVPTSSEKSSKKRERPAELVVPKQEEANEPFINAPALLPPKKRRRPRKHQHDNTCHPIQPLQPPIIPLAEWNVPTPLAMQPNSNAKHMSRIDLSDGITAPKMSRKKGKPAPKSSKIIIQEPRHDGDVYGPFLIRGDNARERQGRCEICEYTHLQTNDPNHAHVKKHESVWLSLRDSEYRYHMTFIHGVSSSTRLPFQVPLKIRLLNGSCWSKTLCPLILSNTVAVPPLLSPVFLEAFCGRCNEWVKLRRFSLVEVNQHEIRQSIFNLVQCYGVGLVNEQSQGTDTLLALAQFHSEKGMPIFARDQDDSDVSTSNSPNSTCSCHTLVQAESFNSAQKLQFYADLEYFVAGKNARKWFKHANKCQK